MTIINHNGESISIKELVMIERILHYYGIEFYSALKIGTVYKVDTPMGYLCIKRRSHSGGKIKNICYIIDTLQKHDIGCDYHYYRTITGDISVRYGKYTFFVTRWFEGTSCNLQNISEAEKCLELMAKFHTALSSVKVNQMKIKSTLKNLPKIYYDYLLDFEGYKEQIKSKIIKTQFDYLYLEYIDSYYMRGASALSLLNSCNYFALARKASEVGSVCHNRFYGDSLIKAENNMYIIDFDNISVDIQIVDLGKLLRKLMVKDEYCWDFKKALNLITLYSKFKPIKKEELAMVLALTIFPYKYWKLGKGRYKKHKDWSEIKYMQKLNKLLKYYNEEQKYIEEFMNYISSLITLENNTHYNF